MTNLEKIDAYVLQPCEFILYAVSLIVIMGSLVDIIVGYINQVKPTPQQIKDQKFLKSNWDFRITLFSEGMVLSLTLILAAEIIKMFTLKSWTQIGKITCIVLLKFLIAWGLEREIKIRDD